MPSHKNEKELRKHLRIIILVVVGIIAFLVSILTNIIGMKQAINQESDTSGMVGFSVRNSGTASREKKETKVDSNGKIAEEDILTNAVPLVKLNNNGWDRVKAAFSGFQVDENGNTVFSDGYTLYCNGKYVNYVVFSSDYKGEVVGHLKVGTDLKTVERTLGTPTFQSKDYLGYKTREEYVFFYEDEISVYPNGNISNKKLEELFESYLNKTYEKERTYFVVDIRENYEDFTIELDSKTNVITLTSVTRQVIAKLDSLGNIEVEFYNGYKIANDSTKEYINQKLYVTNEEDLVEIAENERVSGK